MSDVDISKWRARPVVPVFAMIAHVPLASRDLFFDALKNYSEQNGFTFEVNWVLENENTMDVLMKRDDGLLYVGNGFNREEFHIDLTAKNDIAFPVETGSALKVNLLKGLQVVPKIAIKDRVVSR